ncbi:YcxB family protein [Brevundimonas sp.]|uniref:YcxB family protein n=1 Tax=Brevundimonas sp. TaxID=1871086 RepID=UPI003D11D49E
MTIVVEEVQPTAHELRPLRKGWGRLHWVMNLPLWVGFIGFGLFGLAALKSSDNAFPPLLLIVSLLATYLAWALSVKLVACVIARVEKRAPVGKPVWRWTLDDRGLTQEASLQSSFYDWRAIKDVRVEADRFVFLILPGFNPVLPRRLLDADQVRALENLIATRTFAR